MPMRIVTPHFRDAVKTGSLNGFIVDAAGANITIIVIYGWSGGHQSAEAAARTDDLAAIARAELAEQPIGHKMIMGDVNGEMDDFPTFAAMLKDKGWTDAGAAAHIWGGTSYQPTCHASAKARQTRRDYILINASLLPAVVGVRVSTEDTFPTYQPLQIKLATTKLDVEYRKPRDTASAAQAVQAKLEEAIDGKSSRESAAIKRQLKEELHEKMDEQLEQRAERMEKAANGNDATTLWKLITASMEAAFIDFLKLSKDQARAMRGRGVVTFTTTTAKPTDDTKDGPEP